MERYWKEVGIGFIIIIAAIALLIYFNKPAIKEEGFSEDYCISLLKQHSTFDNLEFV